MKSTSEQFAFQIYREGEAPLQFDQGLCILFGLQGRSLVTCGKDEYELLPAGLLVINPFALYTVSCPGGGALIGLHISRVLLGIAHWREDQKCSCYARSDDEAQPEYQKLRALFADIFQRYLQDAGQSASILASDLLQLTGYLQSDFSVPAGESAGVQRETAMLRLKRVLDTIHQHWNEDISLSAIAREEFLSDSYLSRFFQKYLGISFSQYLLQLRLRRAAQSLVQGSRSVTYVAYECGFRSVNVFIEAFKRQYGQTPGRYRKEQQLLRRQQEEMAGQGDFRSLVAPLMAYAAPDTATEIPNVTLPVSVNCARPGQALGHIWKDLVNIGYARDGLVATVQEQLRRAQSDIGFRYLRFHGLFDRDMYIYHEDEAGEPVLNFTHLDLLFDFILSIGLRPYAELSFMPVQLAVEETVIADRYSVISGCRDLGKWTRLVTGTLRHLIERYGLEQVRSWRFTTVSLGYAYFGCISHTDYLDLYRATWRAVKSVDQGLSFGGPGCFAELVTREDGVPAFLRFAREQGCLPDFIAMQSHPYQQVVNDPLYMSFWMNQQSAPTILSKDVDSMAHMLDKLEALLEEQGLGRPELFIEECNATLWQRDLSNETCYKAAWLMKNVCENYDRAVIGYWLLTDFIEERANLLSLFHGGYGLMTYNGIPKAGYQAMRLLARLGDRLVERGPGWMLTRTGEAYQLVIYNYTHYNNLFRYRYQILEEPKQAYTVFEAGENRRLQFRLQGLPPGAYRLERRRITRSSGSSFDKWLELGCPDYPSREQCRYLSDGAQPSYQVETARADQGGLQVEALLGPLESELILLRRIQEIPADERYSQK